jgi:hypothetical protein
VEVRTRTVSHRQANRNSQTLIEYLDIGRRLIFPATRRNQFAIKRNQEAMKRGDWSFGRLWVRQEWTRAKKLARLGARLICLNETDFLMSDFTAQFQAYVVLSRIADDLEIFGPPALRFDQGPVPGSPVLGGSQPEDLARVRLSSRSGRRLHAGKFTEPRTREGREGSRHARWSHAAYSQETRALLAENRRRWRALRALLGEL